MINLNGQILKEEDATVGINNRGLHYGDAIFETMRFANGKIFFWQDHYLRLSSSLKILKYEISKGFTKEFLEKEILKTISASNCLDRALRVKLLIWRKTGGKYTPIHNTIEYAVLVEDLGASLYSLTNAKYKVGLYEDHYISSGVLSSLKSTNRLINILGSVFANKNGYHNCILLNEDKNIVEALNANIFVVKGDVLITPPIEDGCLNGVMRKQIISIVNDLEAMKLQEKSIAFHDFLEADEVFICNVIQGLITITDYNEKSFENNIAKILLPKLNALVVGN